MLTCLVFLFFVPLPPPDHAEARSLLERARLAMQQNRLNEARQAAEKALQHDPKLGDAELILGLVFTAADDLGNAEKHFVRAVTIAPKNPSAHGYLGSTYLAEQRLGEAEAAFLKVLKLDPGNLTAHYNLGAIAILSRRRELAIEHFEAAVQAQPSDLPSLGALLQVQLELGRKKAARITAGRLERLLPAEDPRLKEAALLLASAGEYDHAIQILRRIQEAGRASADLAFNLGLAYFRAGKPAMAIQQLEPFSDNSQALNLLGVVRESVAERAQGLADLAKAAALSPANENYRLDHAAALLRHSDTEEALRAFQAIAEAFPDSPRATLGLGCAFYIAGQYDKAAETFLKSAEQKQGNVPLVYQLLQMAVQAAPEYRGRALVAFRRHLERDSPDARAHCDLASILLKETPGGSSGDTAEAKRHLQRALALDPKLAEAHLHLGSLAQGAGQLQDSIRHFARATELAPHLAEAHYRLARMYARVGQKEQSRAHMQHFQRVKMQGPAEERRLFIQASGSTLTARLP